MQCSVLLVVYPEPELAPVRGKGAYPLHLQVDQIYDPSMPESALPTGGLRAFIKAHRIACS